MYSDHRSLQLSLSRLASSSGPSRASFSTLKNWDGPGDKAKPQDATLESTQTACICVPGSWHMEKFILCMGFLFRNNNYMKFAPKNYYSWATQKFMYNDSEFYACPWSIFIINVDWIKLDWPACRGDCDHDIYKAYLSLIYHHPGLTSLILDELALACIHYNNIIAIEFLATTQWAIRSQCMPDFEWVCVHRRLMHGMLK